jgi:hypothetical protein
MWYFVKLNKKLLFVIIPVIKIIFSVQPYSKKMAKMVQDDYIVIKKIYRFQ